MKTIGAAPRAIALALCLALGLPNPAFALRVQSSKQSSGLEELYQALTGLEETDLRSRLQELYDKLSAAQTKQDWLAVAQLLGSAPEVPQADRTPEIQALLLKIQGFQVNLLVVRHLLGERPGAEVLDDLSKGLPLIPPLLEPQASVSARFQDQLREILVRVVQALGEARRLSEQEAERYLLIPNAKLHQGSAWLTLMGLAIKDAQDLVRVIPRGKEHVFSLWDHPEVEPLLVKAFASFASAVPITDPAQWIDKDQEQAMLLNLARILIGTFREGAGETRPLPSPDELRSALSIARGLGSASGGLAPFQNSASELRQAATGARMLSAMAEWVGLPITAKNLDALAQKFAAGLEEMEIGRLVEAYGLRQEIAEKAVRNGWTLKKLRELEELNQRFSNFFQEKYGFTNRPKFLFKPDVSPHWIATVSGPEGSWIAVDISRTPYLYAKEGINRWYLEEWSHSFQAGLMGERFASFPGLVPGQWNELFSALEKGFPAPDKRFALPPFDVSPFLVIPRWAEAVSSFEIEVVRKAMEVHAAALGWVLSLDWIPREPKDPSDRPGAFWEASLPHEEKVFLSLRKSGHILEAEYGVTYLASEAAVLEVLLEMDQKAQFLASPLKKQAKRLLKRYTREAANPQPFQAPFFSQLKQAYKDYFLSTLQPFRYLLPSTAGLEEGIEEPQLGKDNAYARSLKKLLDGPEVTQHSVKRLRVLKRIGPELEAYTRSLLRNPRVKIAIVPLGSTLLGYAKADSDVDAAIYIVDGADPNLFAIDSFLGRQILLKLNRLLKREGFQGDKMAPDFLPDDIVNMPNLIRLKAPPSRYSVQVEYALATLFSPVAYGDAQRIEQLRRDALSFLRNQTRYRWQAIRRRHQELVGVVWQDHPDELLYELFDKPHLRRWLSQQGVDTASAQAVQTFDRKRYRKVGLPSLHEMLRIYHISPKPSLAGLEEVRTTHQGKMDVLTFAQQATATSVRVVIGSSAFEQVPGLRQVVELFSRAGLEERFLLLPEESLPEAELTERLIDLAAEAFAVPNLSLVAYAGLEDRSMQRFEGMARMAGVPFQWHPPTTLQPLVRQILVDLGVPEADATEEAVGRFLEFAGLEEAA